MIRFLAFEPASAGATAGPADWPGIELASMQLRHAPDTPIIASLAGPLVLVGELFDEYGVRVGELSSAQANATVTSRGRWFVETFWGRYVLFYRDPADGALCILRDPSGAVPVYYRHDHETITLCTDIADLAYDAGRRWPVDRNGLAHQLWYPSLPTRRTSLEGWFELLPGELLRAVPGAPNVQIWSPWPHTARRLAHPADDLGRVVQMAVGALARDRASIVLELSGGLDSSILASSLAASAARWRAVTLYAPAADGDERPFARLAASKARVPLDEIALRPEDFDLLALPVRPGVRPSGLGMIGALDRAFASAADAAGGAMLVSGTGGDNVFCALRSTAPVLEALRLRGARTAWAASIDVSARTQSPIAAVLISALRYAARDRLRPRRWPVQPLLLAADSRPPLDHHPWLDRPKDGTAGARAHIASILRAHPVVAALERARDHDMIFPLLTQPVVETCLAVPAWQWVAGGVDRAVARAAFRDRLPPAVLERTGKGRLTSLLGPAYDRDRARLGAILEDGVLAGLGLVDRVAVRRAVLAPAGTDDRLYTRVMELADAELWARSVTERR